MECATRRSKLAAGLNFESIALQFHNIGSVLIRKTDGNPSSVRWMDVHLPNSDKLVQPMRRNALEERCDMKLLVLQHAAAEHPGIFRGFLEEDGHSWDAVELDEGEQLPALGGYDGLWVMGGPMDVWQEELHPWLKAEKEIIREAVEGRGMAFLGLCLGHQLLAEALGGSVGPAETPEIGVLNVQLTEEGGIRRISGWAARKVSMSAVAFRGSDADSCRCAGAGDVTRLPGASHEMGTTRLFCAVSHRGRAGHSEKLGRNPGICRGA